MPTAEEFSQAVYPTARLPGLFKTALVSFALAAWRVAGYLGNLSIRF